ncbi:MAG: NAD(P)H-dependent oxidoreductase subunit E [Chitinispirillaceae bacterium]|nr:NAD(P)H-dependent oxidoreductase subunit E [Chitinispirillaceae bacterium]
MYLNNNEEATLFGSNPQHADVVVIDDDDSMCEGCRQTLEAGGFRAAVARNGNDGLRLVRHTRPHVALVDLKMPGIPGLEVMAKIPQIDSSIVIVVITGHGTIDTAVESMKIGAFDFLTKPFDPERLLETVQRGIKLSEIRKTPASTAKETMAAPKQPMPQKVDKHEVLLEGLAMLMHGYEAGLERQDVLNELRYLESEAKYHAESLGQVKKREKAILDIINQLKVVDEIIEKHGFRKNALIQILLDIQARLNWLPRHTLKWLSARLGVSLAEINTIAHFYGAFSLEPRGRHTIEVCLGTACHVRGGTDLLAKISALLGLKAGETDTQQIFTLKTVHCLGCCALAPVMQIDGKPYSNPSLDQMKKLFASIQNEEELVCRN